MANCPSQTDEEELSDKEMLFLGTAVIKASV